MKKFTLVLIAILGFTFITTTAKSTEGSPFSLKDGYKSTTLFAPTSTINFDQTFTFDSNSPDKKKKGKKKAFNKGNMLMSMGYGLYTYVNAAFAFEELGLKTTSILWGTTDIKRSGIGPIHAKFEYGIASKIGVGMNIAFLNQSLSWAVPVTVEDINGDDSTYKETFTDKGYSLNITARFNFHVYTGKKLDLYLGMDAGYDIGSYKLTTSLTPEDLADAKAYTPELIVDLNPMKVSVGLTFGARYYFNPNFGIYTEIGYATSLYQIGACYKM